MANGKYININYVTIYGLADMNDNIRYVGVTSREPNYRFNNHIYEARKFPERNNRTKWISTNDFKIKQIILDVVLEDEWVFWEAYWISQIKSWGFNLVNSNNGGGGTLSRDVEFSKWLSNRNKGNTYRLGKKHSEESKIKMSKKKIGKISPRKNCIVTEETRLKQSISKLGKNGNAKGFKHSEETKNKKRKLVLQFDSNGLIINEFNSVSETANYFSVSISTISKVLNKENIKYKGFIFKTKTKNNG